MYRNSHNTRQMFRNKALAGAIVAALAFGAAGSASAQSSTGTYTLTPGAPDWTQTLALVNYLHTVGQTQQNNAAISATLNSGPGSVSIFDSYTGGDGSAQTVSDNRVLVQARGNAALDADGSAGNTIDMGLLGADASVPANSGLGLFSAQLDQNSPLTANADNATVSLDLFDYDQGTVTANGNAIRADVRVNAAGNAISGMLPTATFDGTTPGSARLDFNVPPTANTLVNAGDISIGNVQTGLNTAGSDVSMDGASITVTDDVDTTARFSTSGNIIAGTWVGNDGASHVDVAGSKGAPGYAGSVVVSNGQANLDAPASLTIGSNEILTRVDGNLLRNGSGAGSITESNNTLSLNAQGNIASNGIAFADGLDIDGSSGAATLNLDFNLDEVHASTAGDLVVLNVQGNQAGTDISTRITNNGRIMVQALGATADGTAVTLDSNLITASTGGNAADNSVSTDGAVFQGLVSVGNQQVNDGVAISARTDDAWLLSNMTASAGNQGDFSVHANRIGVTAQGNAAHTDASLAGTQFTSGSGVTSASNTVTAGFTTASTVNAGVAVGNSQADFGAGISFTASNNTSWLGEYFRGTITDGSGTVSDNAILATAGANAANTSAHLGGTSGVFTAALVNNQTMNIGLVSGTVTSAFLGIATFDGVSDTSLAVTGNSNEAGAYGNQGTNSLSTGFGDVNAGSGTGWSDPSASITPDAPPSGWAAPNIATGAVALASTQVADGTDFQANLYRSRINVAVSTGDGGGYYAPFGAYGNYAPATRTAVSVSDNHSSATALANQVGNTLGGTLGNLTTMGDATTQVATLSNFQYANDDDVGVTVNNYIHSPMIGAQFAVGFDRSTVTVASNSITGFAGGNLADNAMRITGSNFAPTHDDGGTVSDGLASISAARVDASAAWTLLNAQGGNGGERRVNLNSVRIAIQPQFGDVSNSALTLSDNRIAAEARDNQATNELRLDGYATLATTGALLSAQGGDPAGAATSVYSGVTSSAIQVWATSGSVRNSDLTISGNGLTAAAIANSAGNRFTVQATQLGGSSDDLVATNRGAVFHVAGSAYQTLADYGLTNMQVRHGTVAARVTGQIEGSIDRDFDGGSLSVVDNLMSGLAQSNSATNDLELTAASALASAAINNQQSVASNSGTSAILGFGYRAITASVLSSSLGTQEALPVTVSDNTVIGQAGLNAATNVLDVSASSSVQGTGVTTVGASDDTARFGYRGAIGDYTLYNAQSASSGAEASSDTGLVGVLAYGNGIGQAGATSNLTVGRNRVATQASGNVAGNTIALNGASSVSATTALNSSQTTGDAAQAIRATTKNAEVGIYEGRGGAAITRAVLNVDDNSVAASAAANSASNSISVQPVALNAGVNQATQASVLATGNTAGASNALLNAQRNDASVSAALQDSSIGVNPALLQNVNYARGPLTRSVATVDANRATASASGNSAGNSILLASLPTAVASSALVSNQINTGSISATGINVQIGVYAGAASSTPVTVSGNIISAIGVGNSATNHIGIGN